MIGLFFPKKKGERANGTMDIDDASTSDQSEESVRESNPIVRESTPKNSASSYQSIDSDSNSSSEESARESNRILLESQEGPTVYVSDTSSDSYEYVSSESEASNFDIFSYWRYVYI